MAVLPASEKPMDMRRPYLPGLFTVGNLFFGFLSIIHIMNGNHYAAAWYIILAVLCDGLDGKLARFFADESQFGRILDSLADLVSSGVAPALLLYYGRLSVIPAFGMLICFAYLFSGTYRLARYHTMDSADQSNDYAGLPIPVAAMTIASFWIFLYPAARVVPISWWIILSIALSFLMMTTIPYNWPRMNFKGKWVQIGRTILLIFCVVAFVIFPHYSIFPFFLLYISVGLARWVRGILQGEFPLSSLFVFRFVQDEK